MDKIRQFFNGVFKAFGQGAKTVVASLNVMRGRVSEPQGSSNAIFNGDIVNPVTAKTYLLMEKYAVEDSDFGYALDNIVSLGGTEIVIDVEGLSDNKTAEAVAICYEVLDSMYEGGSQQLANDLLMQVGINGAVSAEAVIRDDMKGIRKIALVPPKQITFRYEDGDYVPYHNPPIFSWPVKLPKITYKYRAFRRFNELPYGIPPLMTSLSGIELENKLWQSIDKVIDRWGLFGFLKVLLNPPKEKVGESPEMYLQRCEQELDRVAGQVKSGLANGFMMGFKGLQEIDVSGTPPRLDGVDGILEKNDLKKMSGLKQDPLMLGRNNSTTEALANVIITKLSAQIGNFQLCVAQVLEEFLRIALLLDGRIDMKAKVTLEFAKPMLADVVKDEQGFQYKINNLAKLVEQGVIKHSQRAALLGWSKPALSDEEFERQKQEKEKQAAARMGFNSDDCPHCRAVDEDMNYDDDFGKTFDKYLKKTRGNYAQATKQLTKDLVDQIVARLDGGITADEVFGMYDLAVETKWPQYFTARQTQIMNESLLKMYREIKALLAKGNPKIGMNRDLSVRDLRVLEFTKKNDAFYLNGIIKDEKLRNKVKDFIKDELFVDGQAPSSNHVIDSFRDKFGDLLGAEDHRIVTVLETSASIVRSYSALGAFNDAGVRAYEIVGLRDSLQCDYCAHLQHQVFYVDRAIENMDKVLNGGLTERNFATTLKIDAFRDMDIAQLQARGIDCPPLHPRCRDTLTAILP